MSIPVHAGLFVEDAYGNVALLGGQCRDCGRYHFPLASSCPYCGSASVTQVRLSSRGTVWGWTAVTTAPPGYNGPVPFGFGVVELPEGLRVITRFEEPDPDRLAFGMAVELTVVDVGTNDDGDPICTYSFAPISDEAVAT